MAVITRIATCSPDGSNPWLPQVADKVAGEALEAGHAVYLKSDGKWWKADGTAATAPAKFRGVVAKAASANCPITVLGPGWRIGGYAAGMTVGASYFVSTTAGALADAATTGGTTAVAYAVSATDIIILANQL